MTQFDDAPLEPRPAAAPVDMGESEGELVDRIEGATVGDGGARRSQEFLHLGRIYCAGHLEASIFQAPPRFTGWAQASPVGLATTIRSPMSDDSASPNSSAPTFFFVHVMKTGGTTFVQHIQANFPPGALYPGAAGGLERLRAYYMIDELRALTPEQRAAIRVYSGHFPYVVREIVGADVTLTILRDPVERTVSYLRHCKRHQKHMHDMALEEIYDDWWRYPLYIHNYQSKLFSMTLDDKLESHLDRIDVDTVRLEAAMANLERVDVLGLNDCYDEFVGEVRDRFGWRIGQARNLRVSTEAWDVPASFRARIAADNAADMAFYERARQIHEGRRRDVRRPAPA